jgi:hypothetical protein
MPRTPSTASRNEVNFTVKLAPSQMRFLGSLKVPLRVSSEQQVLREILDAFRSWFWLPVYQRQRLERELAQKKTHVLQYLQELLARRFEELRAGGRSAASRPSRSTPPARTLTAEPEVAVPFAIRIAPDLLAYADTLKPALQKNATADVIRELVEHLETWCLLPRYQVVRLQQDMVARGLDVLEYLQELLARRYEAIRDEAAAAERSRKR